MKLSEYQRSAARTFKPEEHFHSSLANAVTGLQGELGEFLEMIKKHEFQGHELSKEKLEEEAGDFMFYVAILFNLYCLDGNRILEKNNKKRWTRYPKGFSFEDSQKRVDVNG